MHIIDWFFILIPLLFILAIGIYTQNYMKSVADFMSGGRVAGRYLLAVAKGEMGAGAVVFAATFEIFSKAGFTWVWWGWINIPVGLMIAITGFVVYRYRETRAMTLAQFFELRYSKQFRVFTGYLGFFSGIINFGIIPVIGARFITTFVGWPPVLHLGGFHVETHILVMAVLLSVTLFMTLTGGMITIMVTNCLEGILSQILYLVTIGSLLLLFKWSEIAAVLGDRPPGQSLVNPFDSMGLEDFNIWYVIMGAAVSVYGTMAWQNQTAFNAAGLTPHENRMGNVLGRWRESGKQAVVYLLAICAMTYLMHPDFTAQAGKVLQDLSLISGAHSQEQMKIPMAISHLLPIGVKGAFCAILIMGIFGGDSSHLHSWGSMLVQDVLVPLRKKPFEPHQHIKILRVAIACVAVFVFLFGAFFPLMDYIAMWFAVTMAIYVGGAGAVIIGGLYWKKGTAAGAWTALLSGSLLAVVGILARLIWPKFPLNGMEVSFFSSVIACVVYAVVSLLTCKEDFNIDRMLHRGEYAPISDKTVDAARPLVASLRLSFWERILGIDRDFSRGDKWTTWLLFAWSLGWMLVFSVGGLWNMVSPWSKETWMQFWHVAGIGVPVFIAFVTSIWFTWGGVKDIIDLFRRLRQERINHLDDGTVVGHHNIDEVKSAPQRVKNGI